MTNYEDKNKLDKNDLLLEQWKMAIDLYKHAADFAMKKFNYFIAINGVLLSSLVYSWTFVAEKEDISFTPFGISISLFGLIINFIWMLTQYRGKLYQEFRMNQAAQVEKNLKVEDERVLDLCETRLSDLIKKRKSRINIGTNDLILILGGLLSIVWLILFLWVCNILNWLYNIAYLFCDFLKI